MGLIAKDKKRADRLNFSSTKKAWGAFNALKRQKNSKNGPPHKLKVDGKEITDEKQMAEELNSYFISKVDKLKEKITSVKEPYDPVLHLRKFVPDDLPVFSLELVTEEHVEEVLSKVKNTKSEGQDQLSYYILKMARSALKGPITTIFNISLSSGVFPAAWRDSIILPLHKKLSKMEMANYRNISLVSKLGLTFEKIVHTQLCGHFTKHKLFSKNQHAYITGRSTSTLCTSLYDKCCRAAQTGKFAGVLSCDLKSGFDLIQGELLAQKMSQCYNACGRTTAWLRSYLSGRTQSVRVGKAMSTRMSSSSSLGQGTILSPILFAIATSDLPQAVVNGDVDVFADDINDTVVDTNPAIVVAKLQEDAKKIEDWLHANSLCLADGKTTFILTCNKERKRDALTESLGLVMDGHAIKQSKTIRVLGVLFNRDLTWSSHLHGNPDDPTEKGLLKALSGSLAAVARLPNCPLLSKKMFLTATFNSKLYYGIETWGSLSEGLIRHLQCLQNRAVKLIYKTRSLTVNEKLQLVNWLPVRLMVEKASLLLLYKIKALSACSYFDKFLYSRRSPAWERIPVYETSYGRLLGNSFLPRTISQWNLLPEETRRLPLLHFKRSITANLKDRMK